MYWKQPLYLDESGRLQQAPAWATVFTIIYGTQTKNSQHNVRIKEMTQIMWRGRHNLARAMDLATLHVLKCWHLRL